MLATLLYRLCWVLAAFITSAESYLQDEKIYTVSEVTTRPEPPDGLAAFQNKWSRNVKYPEEAVREKIQGMVFIEFIRQEEWHCHRISHPVRHSQSLR